MLPFAEGRHVREWMACSVECERTVYGSDKKQARVQEKSAALYQCARNAQSSLFPSLHR